VFRWSERFPEDGWHPGVETCGRLLRWFMWLLQTPSCLFSLTQQPKSVPGHFIPEVSISHSQLSSARAISWSQRPLPTRHKHTRPQRVMNPRSQQTSSKAT
jgi:23S rRNA A1618 N6-methylase RlmF